MNKIDYNDEAELRNILVGRKIVKTEKTTTSENIYEVTAINFTLDNGRVLRAVEAVGGCCSNGDWSVDSDATTTQIITDVSVVDECKEDSDSAILRMFIYADGIKTELVRSEGQDNGYYGWGYEVFVTEID